MQTPNKYNVGDQIIQTLDRAETLVELLRANHLYLTAMESCTGGALVDVFTSIPGASDALESASVTYSNAAKIALGVPERTIEDHTVYSREVAEDMARTSLIVATRADIGVGITGSLSRIDPNNATNSVPGEVHISVASAKDCLSQTIRVNEEDRYAAKLHIVRHAIDLTARFVTKHY